MTKANKGHTINVVFVLAVACAFAASVLMVLMLGVRVYSGIEATANAEYKERVCLSYLTVKVHSNDQANSVHVGDFSGVSALFIEEEFDGIAYNTIIYTYDGWLRELFCEKDLELGLDSGTPILEVDSVSFHSEKANLLSIEYIDKEGKNGNAFVHLRSKGGERS